MGSDSSSSSSSSSSSNNKHDSSPGTSSTSDKNMKSEIKQMSLNQEKSKKMKVNDDYNDNGAINFKFQSQKLDISMVILASLLLLSPFMMGQMINALGNEGPIRGYFVYQLDLAEDIGNPGGISDEIWSIGFLFPFGGLIGALFGAFSVDAYGRKYMTIIYTGSMFIGNCCKIISFYTHISSLFVGRFFDGFASAGLMVTSITWIFECLPKKIHYIYKPMIQILINFGIFFTSIFQINIIMMEFFYLTYFASIIAAFIQLVACLILPESPKFLYSKTKDKLKAEAALRKLRQGGYDENELKEIMEEVDSEKKIVKMSLIEFLKSQKFIRVALIAMFIHLSQQISGINAIVAFTGTILTTANIGQPDQSTLIILGIGLAGSIIFAPLVSNFPRKIMLVIGHASMAISFSFLMIIIYFEVLPEVQILFYAFFMFIFQLGPGPLVWFISMEIFPPSTVGAAQGVTTMANWFGNTMIYLLFPIINGRIGTDVLFIFVVLNILISIVFAVFVVETKGKTPDQVLSDYESRFKSLHLQ